VDRSAKLKLAAERMTLVKTCNAGQWCVDADYVLVDKAVEADFVKEVVRAAGGLLGDTDSQLGDGIPLKDRWISRIVDARHAARLKAFLDEAHGGTVVMGGPEKCNVDAKFIPFTVVVNPNLKSKLMTEEIFGPILVIYSVDNVDEAISVMKNVCATPLAMYVYAEDTKYTEKVVRKCQSGSVGVNTTCEQSLGSCSPFGGVGQSGMGAYHGKFGFEEFSHMRTILYKTTALPVHFIPKPLWPVANRFPSFVPAIVHRICIAGLVPAPVRIVLKAFFVVLLAIALLSIKQVAMAHS